MSREIRSHLKGLSTIGEGDRAVVVANDVAPNQSIALQSVDPSPKTVQLNQANVLIGSRRSGSCEFQLCLHSEFPALRRLQIVAREEGDG